MNSLNTGLEARRCVLSPKLSSHTANGPNAPLCQSEIQNNGMRQSQASLLWGGGGGWVLQVRFCRYRFPLPVHLGYKGIRGAVGLGVRIQVHCISGPKWGGLGFIVNSKGLLKFKAKGAGRFYQIPNQVALELKPVAAQSDMGAAARGRRALRPGRDQVHVLVRQRDGEGAHGQVRFSLTGEFGYRGVRGAAAALYKRTLPPQVGERLCHYRFSPTGDFGYRGVKGRGGCTV